MILIFSMEILLFLVVLLELFLYFCETMGKEIWFKRKTLGDIYHIITGTLFVYHRWQYKAIDKI